jgi:hypothetical protein
LSFTSRKLSKRNLGKPIYEKEMLAILHGVDLWCPYISGQCFQIKKDHQSLKYFLEQRISSPKQQKWVTNLFGYDYEIIYKKGKNNVVADALSRKYEEEGSIFSLSFIVPDWLQAVHQEWLQDPKSSHLIQQLQIDAPTPLGYSWLQDELRYKGQRSFLWDGMKQDIRNFVVECEVCQCNKGETIKSPGNTTTASDSTCYLEGYLYGLYYQLTQIEK